MIFKIAIFFFIIVFNRIVTMFDDIKNMFFFSSFIISKVLSSSTTLDGRHWKKTRENRYFLVFRGIKPYRKNNEGVLQTVDGFRIIEILCSVIGNVDDYSGFLSTSRTRGIVRIRLINIYY